MEFDLVSSAGKGRVAKLRASGSHSKQLTDCSSYQPRTRKGEDIKANVGPYKAKPFAGPVSPHRLKPEFSSSEIIMSLIFHSVPHASLTHN